jgi:hypothetical protein
MLLSFIFYIVEVLTEFVKNFSSASASQPAMATLSVFNNYLAFNASVIFCWALY